MRSGLEMLLKGWGATVENFDTVPASTNWARQCDPLLAQARLLIVDYRLEGGHDAEADKHDFHLLIKPVVANGLRAMIGFKLGLR